MNNHLSQVFDYFWSTYEGKADGCGCWHLQTKEYACCHVVKEQVRAYGTTRQVQGRALFLPEPVCGDASNEVMFVGINPGQAQANEDAEFEWCLNTVRNPHLDRPLTRGSYCDYYVDWYRGHVGSAKYDEPVSRAALDILSHAHRSSGEPELLQKLTFLNVGHCKSPPGVRLRASVLDKCGRKSFEYLARSGARVVVCLGPQVWDNWLARAIIGNTRNAPWTAELKGCDVTW